MANVEISEVSKIYPGGVRAVDSINLSIADQSFIVLVGPSGCGKSTTLRMVAGLEEISEGTIEIGGRVVNHVAPKDRDIAMVFQNYALYPHMSVYNNMAFGLKLRRVPKAEIHKRVSDAARILEISHLLERKPKALSGGQRQRVAVGRAIVREPAAFLFDEPLSNLDAKLRVSTRAELKRLHQRLKTTTIYVTHDQEEAMTLGDRIVLMKDGKIQQADTPLDTYNLPANRYVAGFIGTPPMNFFDGIIQAVDGGLSFAERREGAENANGLRPFSFPLPNFWKDALAGKVGQQVVLGVRPEHLNLARRSDNPAGIPIRMNVQVIEPLGNTMDIFLSTALHAHVVARVEATDSVTPGSALELYPDVRRIHFFEPGDTGIALRTARHAAALA